MRRLLALLVLPLLAGCPPSIPPPAHAYPPGALDLPFDRSYVDAVDCKREDCERWFRVTAPGHGDLRVGVRALTSGGQTPRFVVQLFESDGDALARESSLGQSNVHVDQRVFEQSYLVSVVSAPGAGRFDFSITASFDALVAAPAPAREPEPQFVTHRSQVLEAVGYGRETTAVLIESGAQHGMEVGYEGRLVDGGAEIGRVVIEQVYADGSRARVEGSLEAPVTHATIAEIQVPAGRLVEDPVRDQGEPVPDQEPLFPWEDESIDP